METIYNVCIREKSSPKECQLYADKQHSPVFQAVQEALGDKADAETVINEWMMELRKKEDQFLEDHTDISEINSVLRDKSKT